MRAIQFLDLIFGVFDLAVFPQFLQQVLLGHTLLEGDAPVPQTLPQGTQCLLTHHLLLRGHIARVQFLQAD